MVYILDEGSEFDAPIEKIWGYLQSEGHAHPSMKILKREMPSPNIVELTSEREMNGKKFNTKVRITLYPPFGMVQEHLEGPTAGSKSFSYYTPKGNKTGITVVGDFKAEGMNEEDTKKAILAQMQVSFDEDNANLKNMK
jgi:hypothetical protein